MRLINVIAQHQEQGTSLRALIDACKLDRTTAWRMLQSLQHLGLVVQDADSSLYHLGLQATAWGATSFTHCALIAQCTPVMKTLARLSGDNVFLVLRLGDHSHCLHLEAGTHAVRSFNQTVGEMRLLGLGVGSIAMLAALSDEAVLQHHRRHSEAYALEGVGAAQLQRWVLNTRQRGFAYRNTAGIAAVGLHWSLGAGAIAAMSIGASKARLPLSRATELAPVMARHMQALRAPVPTPA